MNKWKKVLPIVFAASLLVGPSAFAASSSTISSGTLSISSAPVIGDFGAITLNGAVQDTTATIGSFTVDDATGSGNGWNVNVSASQLTDSTTGNKIPDGSISLSSAPSVTADTGSSDASTIAVASTGNSSTIDTPTGLKLLSASQNGGMGTFSIGASTLQLQLNPATTYAGTYTSTVSVNVTAGP